MLRAKIKAGKKYYSRVNRPHTEILRCDLITEMFVDNLQLCVEIKSSRKKSWKSKLADGRYTAMFLDNQKLIFKIKTARKMLLKSLSGG